MNIFSLRAISSLFHISTLCNIIILRIAYRYLLLMVIRAYHIIDEEWCGVYFRPVTLRLLISVSRTSVLNSSDHFEWRSFRSTLLIMLNAFCSSTVFEAKLMNLRALRIRRWRNQLLRIQLEQEFARSNKLIVYEYYRILVICTHVRNFIVKLTRIWRSFLNLYVNALSGRKSAYFAYELGEVIFLEKPWEEIRYRIFAYKKKLR